MKRLLKKGRSSVLILTVYVSSFFLFSACTEEKAEPFSFAVVSDTHYKHSISETFVRPFAEEIQTTYPEVCFVAHAGDFADPFEPAYYENILLKFRENERLGLAGGIRFDLCNGKFRKTLYIAVVIAVKSSLTFCKISQSTEKTVIALFNRTR